MDAYELANSLKQMWVDWTDKSSGTGTKIGDIRVCVHVPGVGYREVNGLQYNPTSKTIEIKLEKE